MDPAPAPGRRHSASDRVVDMALTLFAEHGVSGTSLQMIADALGVTKAAVYHQFNSKEEIVLAVIAPALEQLTVVTEDAERRRTPAARRDAVLAGLVDFVVDNRSLAAVMHGDPAVTHALQSHEPLRHLGDRVIGLLSGPEPDPEFRVAAVMVTGGVMIAGADPQLSAVRDDVLREQLLRTARRALRLRSRT